ncbi:MAG: hypothetical protein HZB39_04145 [Planctomycetes bacterium]|nr:hypothetical protein [Planctomycetota bacterium]
MLLRNFIPVLLSLGLAPNLLADRFHLGSPDTAAKITDGTPDFVQGVLLREENGAYVIRVEGGEMQLQKSLVWKVESDGLTVEQVQKRETERAEELARANARRAVQLGAAAEARFERLREVRAAEAAAKREEQSRAVEAVAGSRTVYDPILHTAVEVGVGGIVGDTVRRELGGVLRNALERDLRDVRRAVRDSLRR